jgi:hypothetical protein
MPVWIFATAASARATTVLVLGDLDAGLASCGFEVAAVALRDPQHRTSEIDVEPPSPIGAGRIARCAEASVPSHWPRPHGPLH